MSAISDEEVFTLWLNKNERLVWSVARDFSIPGMALEDVAQEMRTACWIAAMNFREDEGVRFSTFATACMRHHGQTLATASARLRRDGDCVSLDQLVCEDSEATSILESLVPSPVDLHAEFEVLLILEAMDRVLKDYPETTRRFLQGCVAGEKATRLARKLGIRRAELYRNLRRFNRDMTRALAWSGIRG